MRNSAPETLERRSGAGHALARVHVLATGGTIAGAAGSDVDRGYRSGEVAVEGLLAAVPGLGALAHLTGEQVAQVGSQDMNDQLWLTLAARVNALFTRDDADGVVITHGTDTVEETGFFLHLAVKSDRPVVLTGAMRPATALSADGPLNLYNAVAVAADLGARARGAIVVLNDDLHSARDVTKASTTDVQRSCRQAQVCWAQPATAASAISAVRHEGTRLIRSLRSIRSSSSRVSTSCSPMPACRPTWFAPACRLGRAASSWRAWATATCPPTRPMHWPRRPARACWSCAARAW